MRLRQLFEAKIYEAETPQGVVCIYAGRFHPFHKGHKAVFDAAVKAYGMENCYIATSGKTDGNKSPFTFEEKKAMMVLTGVPENRIVETRVPYQPKEILDNYDSTTTVAKFMVGAKDMDTDPRFQFGPKKDGSPSYLQDADSNRGNYETFDKHAYVVTAPTLNFKVLGQPATSATELRAQYATLDDATAEKFITDLFGNFDQNVMDAMDAKLGRNPASEPTEAFENKSLTLETLLEFLLLENPWQGKDEAKAAAWNKLSPEDQKWLGNADPTDEFILSRAPNKGKPAQTAPASDTGSEDNMDDEANTGVDPGSEDNMDDAANTTPQVQQAPQGRQAAPSVPVDDETTLSQNNPRNNPAPAADPNAGSEDNMDDEANTGVDQGSEDNMDDAANTGEIPAQKFSTPSARAATKQQAQQAQVDVGTPVAEPAQQPEPKDAVGKGRNNTARARGGKGSGNTAQPAQQGQEEPGVMDKIGQAASSAWDTVSGWFGGGDEQGAAPGGQQAPAQQQQPQNAQQAQATAGNAVQPDPNAQKAQAQGAGAGDANPPQGKQAPAAAPATPAAPTGKKITDPHTIAANAALKKQTDALSAAGELAPKQPGGFKMPGDKGYTPRQQTGFKAPGDPGYTRAGSGKVSQAAWDQHFKQMQDLINDPDVSAADKKALQARLEKDRAEAAGVKQDWQGAGKGVGSKATSAGVKQDWQGAGKGVGNKRVSAGAKADWQGAGRGAAQTQPKAQQNTKQDIERQRREIQNQIKQLTQKLAQLR